MRPLITPPPIDRRTAGGLTRTLRGRAPHYVREWSARDDTDPGVGLIGIFSSIAEGVIERLNAAPRRNFIAFLEMMGIRLLPATPARAPVRFVPATGTETTILVPPRTQVSATTAGGELTFETESSLLAVPGTLAALVAVDPEVDAILEPPPSFLPLATAARDEELRTIVAFSSAGSSSFQLDLVDELKENDILRITSGSGSSAGDGGCGCDGAKSGATGAAAEYVVVQKVQGHVVSVQQPLRRDYAEGDRVQKVTRFTLFEGRNLQEHILYLGHHELFNVKSAATFEVLVAPRPGTSSAGLPLNVAWEFWGVPEGSKDDPTWHLLTIEADGSAGLTQPGRIVLSKIPGEIQEREVNGVETRWIRARLAEPILPGRRDQLPVLDSVTFRTLSAEEGIAADAGFFNETPLDVNVEFRPFGFEPRTFDRFYLGSVEGFSKPGAEVEIQTDLDVSDLLSTPAVVRYQSRTFAFAHGAGGRLLRFESDPTAGPPPAPLDFLRPPGTRLTAGTTPAASVNGSALGVVFRADDGFVWLARFRDDQQLTADWSSLQAPVGIRSLRSDPIIVTAGSLWRVFVAADNDVYTRLVDPVSLDTPTFQWEATNLPAPPASTPFAAATEDDATHWVFVTDARGVCYRLRGIGLGWDVATPSSAGGSPDESFLSAPGARPFARLYEGADESTRATVFLHAKTNRIVELDVPVLPAVADPIVGRDWGAPPSGADSNPWALGRRPDEWRLFVRGADDGLWEARQPKEFRLHTNLAGGRLKKDPIAIAHTARIRSTEETFISVFSASNRNSLIEFRERRGAQEEGTLDAGPGELAFIAPGSGATRPAEGDYVHLPDSSGREARQVRRYETNGEFAVLASSWNDLPETDAKVELLESVSEGAVVAADDIEITLQDDSNAAKDLYIVVHRSDRPDVLRKIEKFDDATDVATVDQPWGDNPEAGDTYEVLEKKRAAGRIARGSEDSVVLATSASQPVNAFITFPATSISPRRIKSYSGSSRLVVVAEPFDGNPARGTDYEIVVSPLREKWDEHQEAAQTELRPRLSWEYWNGLSWSSLRVSDGTQHLLVPGVVRFRTPDDIAETDVAGQPNYWIRARIVGGDYGREIFLISDDNKIEVKKDPIRPPLIKKLTIEYRLTDDQPPERCLTFNNLGYIDQTAANNTPDKHFVPFAALADSARTVYFGFDKPFRGGPVRLFVAARELAVDETRTPRLAWEFRTETGWKTVPVEDDTNAYTQEELITLQVPDFLPRRAEFGRTLHWLRSRLREGTWPTSPVLGGVFLNSIWTRQAETILNEILGSSNAAADQQFRFQRKPVLPGEEVRVRELLTGDERGEITRVGGKGALIEIKDQQGSVLETWTRWTPVDEFFEATGESRVYRLDRASAEIAFGDGVHGRVPPAGGDNIVAFTYQSGGGVIGNVLAGTITTLVTAVAGIDSVTNPVAAGGGSEEATVDQMLQIGPAQISHRGRAVTPQDFESLAEEASRQVRKTRCVPNRNARGQRQSGAVSVFIVPDSTDAIPVPSLELRRAVRRHLEGACDVTVASRSGVFVGPPAYVPVNVSVTVFVKTIDTTAVAERRANEALSAFLHPLTGGVDGTGWDFGQDLSASHLYRLLENISDIDHVENLVLGTARGEFRDRLDIGDDELIASGEHQIRMAVANGG